MRFALLVVLVATAAEARPLPKGMTVTLKKDTLYATQDGITVPLRDEASALADQVSDLQGAELSADGKDIVVKINSCMGDEVVVPLAAVTARFENLRGMQAHLKKKYADAIPHFAAAAKADPDTPLYATNLLSAQSMANLVDDADATLVTYAPKHAAWFAWRFVVDKELASLRTRPTTKAWVAAKPSKLKVDPMGAAIAVSPTGLVAVREWVFFGGPGAPDDGFDLALYDPSEPDVAPVRLTGVSYADACHGFEQRCTRSQLAKQAARKKTLEPVLAGLAFERRPTVWVDAAGSDGNRRSVIESPDRSTTIKVTELPSGEITYDVLRGKAVASIKLDRDPKKIAFAGNIVVLQFVEKAFVGCSGDAQRSYSKVIRVD